MANQQFKVTLFILLLSLLIVIAILSLGFASDTDNINYKTNEIVAVEQIIIDNTVAINSEIIEVNTDKHITIIQDSVKTASKPMIALTFDDGPEPGITDQILDVLKQHDAKATFYVLGKNVNKYPELINRIVSEEHELGNHSYSHIYFTEANASQILAEINKTHFAIYNVTNGYLPKTLRPPFGRYDELTIETSYLPLILWNVDTRDWEHRDSSKTIQTVLSNAEDGAIIVMHDVYHETALAMEVVVPQLIERGFQLVTISELFASKGIEMQSGVVYR